MDTKIVKIKSPPLQKKLSKKPLTLDSLRKLVCKKVGIHNHCLSIEVFISQDGINDIKDKDAYKNRCKLILMGDAILGHPETHKISYDWLFTDKTQKKGEFIFLQCVMNEHAKRIRGVEYVGYDNLWFPSSLQVCDKNKDGDHLITYGSCINGVLLYAFN